MTERPWPESLPSAAFHGIAGEFVELVEPHTESDPAALLFQFVVAAGNVIGRRPYYQHEQTRHHLNLFLVLAGESSSSRKGTSWNHVRSLFAQVDRAWEQRVEDGALATGEGLISLVRDPDILDKRLLAFEPEFASTLKNIRRGGNTLSPKLRQSWDSATLRNASRNNPLTATGAHISVVAHVTPIEIRRLLNESEIANGFGNRFLYAVAKRSKLLPHGGEVDPALLSNLVRNVRERVEEARVIDRVDMNGASRNLWMDVYPLSAAPGLVGNLTHRAEAQCWRVASIFAVLDKSKKIREQHLQAALPLVSYSQASVRYLFRDEVGNQISDEILALLETGPITKTQLSKHYANHRTEEIDDALELLLDNGLVARERSDGRGRPTVTYHLGSEKEAK